MPVRRRSYSRRVSRPTRKLVWNRHFTETNITTSNAGFVYDLMNPLQTDMGAKLLGATIMRVRGQILYSAGAISGISTNNQVGMGLIRVSTANEPTQFGALTTNQGAASIGPVGATGRHRDWFGYDTAWVPANNWVEHTVDFKSSRKIDEVDDGMALIIAAPQLLNAGSWLVNCRLSVLVALH